jgi:hypothetical protein
MIQSFAARAASAVLLTALMAGTASQTVAQTSEGASRAVSLEQYKLLGLKVRGPNDGVFFSITLPAHWSVKTPSSIEFDLDVLIPGDPGNDTAAASVGTAPVTVTTGSQTGSGRCIAGTFNVSMNEQFLGAFPLIGSGPRRLSVPITAAALKPRTPDAAGVYNVFVGFDAPDRCGVDQYAQVFLRPSTRFVFSASTVEPSADLRRLPRPILQGSYEPDRALLVLPDAPSPIELEAALNVAAGFGRITSGALGLTTTTISRITEQMWQDHHVIVVGKPPALPIIGLLKLAQPVKDNAFALSNADDGVIQLATSPYNREKVALVVSGNSDAGVLKAARALSSGAVRPRATPSLAFIADSGASRPAQESFPELRSFGDLGYATQRSQGIGANSFLYEFDAPNSIALTGDAFVELAYVHSALLDYDRSSINVYLNDVAIGSIRLADGSTRLNRTRVLVPEAALRPGANRLVVQTVLNTRSVGRVQNFENTWLSVQADSIVNLRFSSKPAPSVASRLNLANLPKPFSEESTLGTAAFVLPPNDPAAFSAAGAIAFALGQQAGKTVLDLRATFSDRADDIPKELLDTRNLIIVGKAADLPIVETLNARLPAPFEPGENLARERDAGIGYRSAPGDDVGYVQLVPSPWNAQRAILLALGSTDLGVEWAGKAIADGERRARLNGNVAFVNDEQIVAASVRGNAPAAAAQSAAQGEAPRAVAQSSDLAAAATVVSTNGVAAPVTTTAPNAADANTRGLLFILFGLVGFAMVVIIGTALISQMRKRSRA